MAAVTPLILLTLVFLQVLLVFANVYLSSTLTTHDNDAWLSPLGDFAFGFRQLNDTSTNLFMVSIWYNKIPDRTVVWNAKADDDVVKAPTGSQIQLTSKGLTLTSPNGKSIWTAQPNALVSHGAMLDTGNFVLLNNNSTNVWESFKNPTDTLLPNQSLEQDGKLTSRFTETNYTRGRFQLYFQDGDVFLSPLAWPTDFRYDSYYKIDAAASASRLVFNESGDIYVETTNGTRIQPQGQQWDNITLDPKVYYYRATLDFHGVFTHYAYPRSSSAQQGWTILRYVPYNICIAILNDMGSGCCGYNSYCSKENQRPTCNCPDGYSLIDPSNQFGGCQPNFTLGCGADNDGGSQAQPEELYNITILRYVDWPLSDYEKLQPSSQQDCQQSCLIDCMCAVAIFRDETCWKKRLPLSNGRSNSGSHLVLMKTRIAPLGNLGPANSPNPKKEDRAKPVLGLLIGSVVINSLLLATVVLILLLKPRRIVQASSNLESNLHSFTYEALKEATWDFKEELGRGSFGIVYKGKLEAASYNVVAVKKLDRLAQEQEKEFKTELSAIGKTCHKNLVRLIGFCDEGLHRLIVYEFMGNGSLANILFGQPKPIWNLRVRFALDTARGLVYLHEECDTPIIHCDIKPQNILIDERFTAKISDFGLAKLLLSDQSRTNTMIRGTRGYVAPEWFKNVPVTVKVDVYSFGVMLLEIICCRKSVQLMDSEEEERAILTDWAYDCYIEKRIDALVENDHEALADIGRLQNWVKIAIWCIQEHHEMRPTMGKVMQMLQGSVEVPNPPWPSSFTSIS
ncbi:G-type lectin S-receptor-like serine/threonine-protein kinase LECRK3 [Gastrolobium bilobum]|uniref:G-type lectin S-receptor-like serine/threonine-protein kinase LECRK3 n=1 Tax=Gastrolobium bilobum TaxID=150636 RepID=UPI002AB24B65|nr:G-type lectin S-receptor-like serine/threonine-protein kinase LECRK3 [Gastrolobium bilobum]